MRKYPATMDAQTVIASVNLNARSDGETLTLVDHAKNEGTGLAPSGGPVKGATAAEIPVFFWRSDNPAFLAACERETMSPPSRFSADGRLVPASQ